MKSQALEQITAAQYQGHLLKTAKIYVQTFKLNQKDLWDMQGSWKAAGFDTESISHWDVGGESVLSKLQNLPARDFKQPIIDSIVMVGSYDHQVQMSFYQEGARTGVPVIFMDHPHALLDESSRYLDILSRYLESEARRIRLAPSASGLIYLKVHYQFGERLRLEVISAQPDYIQVDRLLQTWSWPSITDKYSFSSDTFLLGDNTQLDHNQCWRDEFHGVVAVFDRGIDCHLENMARMCVRLGIPPKEDLE